MADFDTLTPRTRRSKKLEKAIKDVHAKYPSMPEELLQEYADAFEIFDADGGGDVDAYELQELMSKVNERDLFDLAAIKLMIESVDRNKNGRIDFQEFVAFMAKSYLPRDEELKNAFGVFDYDGSGYISAKEMYQVLKTLGEDVTEAEIKFIMDEVDSDGDGKVDFTEFKSMMQLGPKK